VYHTTRLAVEDIQDLCALIYRETSASQRAWPTILGLYKSVVAALTYLRRNRVQAEIAETLGVSQPTISRAITTVTPLIELALREAVPTAEDLKPHAQYVVDGTLLPCWSWAKHPQLYSGKHKTTGHNVQVACTLDGTLAWISDAIDGSRHDSHCLTTSGVLEGLDPANWIGDKGYQGHDMLTPIKKPPHRDLLEWEKELNTTINTLRYRIEQVIANFKTWRIMHTDYRRPLDTFRQTLAAVVALHFWTTT
jgi:hypothetical protein